MKTDLTKTHIVAFKIGTIYVNYPAHEPRKNSAGYRAAHKKLVYEMDLPCLGCGVKQSTLKDPKENILGSKMMTTHHHNAEWALINAVDVKQFNKIMLPHLRAKHPDRKDYKTDFTQKQFRDWVDHDLHNLWVLCDVCHMSKREGIHYIPYPLWQLRNLMKKGYVLLPDPKTINKAEVTSYDH